MKNHLSVKNTSLRFGKQASTKSPFSFSSETKSNLQRLDLKVDHSLFREKPQHSLEIFQDQPASEIEPWDVVAVDQDSLQRSQYSNFLDVDIENSSGGIESINFNSELNAAFQNIRTKQRLAGCDHLEQFRAQKTKDLISDEFKLRKLFNKSLDSRVQREISNHLHREFPVEAELDQEFRCQQAISDWSSSLEDLTKDFDQEDSSRDFPKNVLVLDTSGGIKPPTKPPNRGGFGGSDWNSESSDEDWENEGENPEPNYFLLIVLASGIVVFGRVIVDFGYRLMGSSTEKLIKQFLKKRFPKIKNSTQKVVLRKPLLSSIPVILSGSGLLILSYVLHPQYLGALLALIEQAIAILCRELGFLILRWISPRFRQFAQQIGRFFETLGGLIQRFFHHVVIPAALFLRQLAILGLSIFFVFKLCALGIEVSGYFFDKIPDPILEKTQQITGSLAGSEEALIRLFLLNLLKSCSVLVLPLFSQYLQNVEKKDGSSWGTLLFIIAGCFFVVVDPFLFLEKLANILLLNPKISQLVSSKIGRFSSILVIGFFARSEPVLKPYIFPFGLMLYLLRVYELALHATSNFFP